LALSQRNWALDRARGWAARDASAERSVNARPDQQGETLAAKRSRVNSMQFFSVVVDAGAAVPAT
jgi:hypothetical protein